MERRSTFPCFLASAVVMVVAVVLGIGAGTTEASVLTSRNQHHNEPSIKYPHPDYNVVRLKQQRQRQNSDISNVVLELAKRVKESQVTRDRKYSFPIKWQENKGLYPSNVKMNMHGPPQLAEAREKISVFDNNMFATAWITICLLEAQQFTKEAPKPTDSQLSMALEAIGHYHDKNRGYDNSVMNFWPQEFNVSTLMWESTPFNLLKAYAIFDILPAKEVEAVLKLFGLTDVEEYLERIIAMRSLFERAFHIPPDFDDTFVNLGLGALLKSMKSEVPKAFAQWSSKNSNVSSVVDTLRKYAYRPFSSDQNVNTIDVRTYYYLRHFLGDAAAKKQDIALVPTWAQNVDEARKDYFKGVAMPYNMNNVDATVSANAVYGLTASVLSGILPASLLDDDPLVAQVYENTTNMIASQINNKLYQRPDLVLTYYPSVFQFYWFTARTYALLETTQQNKPLPAVMQRVYSTLKPALEKQMTADVVKKAQSLGADMVYFDDFLGDGDYDEFNNTLIRAEDRLFTTSAAVNALLSTWTLFHNNTITWKRDVPVDVRLVVVKAVEFLKDNILEDTPYVPWNVFFSGSSKGASTLPFGYPANRLEFLNGTAIPDDKKIPSSPFLFGMQGYIPESKYGDMLKKTHFGLNTPTEFKSYNEPGEYFPFWTSSEYTWANALLALARYDSIAG